MHQKFSRSAAPAQIPTALRSSDPCTALIVVYVYGYVGDSNAIPCRTKHGMRLKIE